MSESALDILICTNIDHRSFGKVKLSLCLIRHHTMKMYEEMGIQLHTFLTFTLHRGEWLTSCHSHFTPMEKSASTCHLRGWMGPVASVDTMAKRKFPLP